MNILIIEDDREYVPNIVSDCKAAATMCHIPEDKLVFSYCTNLPAALEELNRTDFSFHIVIADINLEGTDLPFGQIENELLLKDVLKEAKFIVHTGQRTERDDILRALHNGAHNYVLKGEEGIDGLEFQLARTMKQIRREYFWSMIGRFCPEWKRREFDNFDLWRRLETGIQTQKAILWCDLSNSTSFAQHQHDHLKPKEYIVKFLRQFFDSNSKIIQSERFGGIIEKFIGDEILAYFSGDQMTDPKVQCESAIDAAIAIRDNYPGWYKNVMQAIPLASPPPDKRPKVRMLVHFGEVIWGVVGSESFSSLSLLSSNLAKGKRVLSHYNKRTNGYYRVIKDGEIGITDDVLDKIDVNKYRIGARRHALKVRNYETVPVYPVIGFASMDFKKR